MDERQHIGYIEREEGFYKLYSPPKDAVVTHALISCKYCNSSIYHCMGPKHDAVCFTCYEKDPELRVYNQEHVYTSRQPWKGLTTEELLQIIDDTLEGGSLLDVACAIENALKEKNV
jgi:hypothetical protein